MSFCEFLSQGWAAESLAALVGVILAIIIEYWPAYEELPARTKQLVYMGLCVLVGFGTWGVALAYGCPAADWWTVLQAVWGAGMAFFAGTAAHRVHVALRGGK